MGRAPKISVGSEGWPGLAARQLRDGDHEVWSSVDQICHIRSHSEEEMICFCNQKLFPHSNFQNTNQSV